MTNEWKYTAAKPYPETLDTLVKVTFRDGVISDTQLVKSWHGNGKPVNSNWYRSGHSFDIVEYEIVTE